MNKSSQKKSSQEGKKVTVGIDEFCNICMEWREYDEDGKCKTCGKLIQRKIQESKKRYNEYEIEDSYNNNDHDGENEY